MSPPLGIDAYLARRLGPGALPKMALNMLTRSFTAPSLASFWRYWNAGTNYYLLYFCYRPLRELVSHGAALLITFIACGFAHDVLFVLPIALLDGEGTPFPFITVWFAIIASCILMSDYFSIDFRQYGRARRVAIHGAFLVTTFAATYFIEKLSSSVI